jgi:hypothetical protein
LGFIIGISPVHNSALLLALAAFNTPLEMTKAALDLSFCLHSLVVQYMAGDFLDFTFDFFDSAFSVVFVHESLLIMNLTMTVAWLTIASNTMHATLKAVCAVTLRYGFSLRDCLRPRLVYIPGMHRRDANVGDSGYISDSDLMCDTVQMTPDVSVTLFLVAETTGNPLIEK